MYHWRHHYICILYVYNVYINICSLTAAAHSIDWCDLIKHRQGTLICYRTFIFNSFLKLRLLGLVLDSSFFVWCLLKKILIINNIWVHIVDSQFLQVQTGNWNLNQHFELRSGLKKPKPLLVCPCVSLCVCVLVAVKLDIRVIPGHKKCGVINTRDCFMAQFLQLFCVEENPCVCVCVC